MCDAGMTLDSITLAEQMRSKDAQIGKLAGTLAHYRCLFSPEGS